MKSFLFNKNSLVYLSKDDALNCIKFNNIVKNQKIDFFFKKDDNFFSIRKKLKNLYISHTRGFVCILELIGLGFSVTAKDSILRFNVGYNHSIFYKVPSDV